MTSQTTSADPDADSAALDVLAQELLDALSAAGFFPATTFPRERFHAFRAAVRDGFAVPSTTMTTIASRMLYGIAAAHRPRRLVGLGTYAGNAFVWLCGPALGADPLYAPAEHVSCDIDVMATDLARANYATVDGGTQIEVVTADAAAVLDGDSTPIDLLFLDVDSPETGKSGYTPLLERALPRLAPGALVVAHDVIHPWFAEDLRPYADLVRDTERFRLTATLDIDPCGLEVTLV
jgi:predicted O-methyltransferase YrrM